MAFSKDIQIYREPFDHAIIEQAFPPSLIEAAAKDWFDWEYGPWNVRYDSALENKRTCHKWHDIPVSSQLLLNYMLALNLYALWDLGSRPVIGDASLWGAGMHSMTRGSHLDIHEDADFHAKFNWERRLNAVLYLNRDWSDGWGGAFELWDKDMTSCQKKIYPRSGRMVLFFPGDGHFHGVPDPLTCPADTQRMTLTTFWYSPPHSGQERKRPRARFVSRPGDVIDHSKISLQERRAQL